MNKDWCRKAIPGFLEMMDALKKAESVHLTVSSRQSP